VAHRSRSGLTISGAPRCFAFATRQRDKADETYALVKAEILGACRSDFPRSTTPLPDGGQKFTKCELLEISIIAVPANPSALVVQRRYSRAGHFKEGRVISGENAELAAEFARQQRIDIAHDLGVAANDGDRFCEPAGRSRVVHIGTNQLSAELAKAVHGEMRRGNVIGYRSSMRISAKTAGSVLGATAP
jgi:hypothetical protein